MENSHSLHTDPTTRTRLLAEPVPGGHPMEIWISHVLRVGVLVASALIALGMSLLIVHGAGPNADHSLHDIRAHEGQPLPVHLMAVVHAALAGHPIAVIQLGVLALILTPVMRVGMTVALFLAEGDRTFSIITTIVLAILVVGLLGLGT